MKDYSISYGGTDNSNKKFYYALNSASPKEVILKVWNQYIGIPEYEVKITIEPGKTYYTEVFSSLRDRYVEFRDSSTYEVVGFFALNGNIGIRDIDSTSYIKKILVHLNDTEKRDLNFICNEVFSSDMYNNNLVYVESGDVVFDIGFNYGLFSLFALHKNAGQIFGFEPNKKLAKLFKDNFESDTIKLYELALGKNNGHVTFYENEWPGKSSIYSDINSNTQKNSYNVELKSFGEFLIENKIEKIDYLKIDCEGAEYDIFSSIPDEYLNSNIKKVAIEFHHRLTDERVSNLINRLRNATFEIKSAYTDGSETGMIYAKKLH